MDQTAKLTLSPPILCKLHTLLYWCNPLFLIFDIQTEHQSTRMSKIKNSGLDQYGAELFEQQQFRTGVEGVKVTKKSKTADTYKNHHTSHSGNADGENLQSIQYNKFRHAIIQTSTKLLQYSQRILYAVCLQQELSSNSTSKHKPTYMTGTVHTFISLTPQRLIP